MKKRTFFITAFGPSGQEKGNRPLEMKDLYWVAGLLEGEGCFTHDGPHRRGKFYPSIHVWMTDRDVVEKLHGLMRSGHKIQTREYKKKGWKTQYGFYVFGNKAAGWMMTLYSLLGERKRAKIRLLLEEWKREDGVNLLKDSAVYSPKRPPRGVS